MAISTVKNDGLEGPIPIAKGGTGATTASAALSALGGQTSLVSGTSIKTLNGASLLGSGNVALDTSLLRSERTANTVIGVSDKNSLIDITSGTFTQTFTAAATLGSGWFLYLKNSGTGDITLDPAGSELIDGLTSFVMYPGEVRLIQCDGLTLRSIVVAGFDKTWTASGNFIMPPGYNGSLSIDIKGAAGGGAGGGKQNEYGGGGGGGGARFAKLVSGLSSGATYALIVGAGGVGGASLLVASADGIGNYGSNGGDTSFSSAVKVYGGISGKQGGGSGGSFYFPNISYGADDYGKGGEPGKGGGGGVTGSASPAEWGGGGGGCGAPTAGSQYTFNTIASCSNHGGGGGGGCGDYSFGYPAGNGGVSGGEVPRGGGGAAGNSGGVAGSSGQDGVLGRMGSGGGGATSVLNGYASGFNGGQGGIPGGGGGGGSPCRSGYNSGKGGDGGRGEINIKGVI
jgi:hypothetical protein